MATPTEAHGAQIQLSNMASTPVFTAIARIDSGPSGPSRSQNMIEAFTHDQNAPTKVATYTNTGPVTFSILYDSSNTQHAALRDAADTKAKRNFRLVLDDTGDEQLAFSAYVTFEWSADPNDFNKANITLEIDGGLTIT